MGLSYEFPLGVKREVIGALRKALDEGYPDENFAGRINVVSEWPLREIKYPLIIVRFQPSEVRTVGIGYYETEENADNWNRVKHWWFTGTLTLEVNALSVVDRDMLMAGLLNLFAFGDEIPQFISFSEELYDDDWIRINILNEHVRFGTEGVSTPPWNDDDTHIFTNSISLDISGEFFSNPELGEFIQISRVVVYPYRADDPIPQGSQLVEGDADDSTVPWMP